VTPQPDVLRFGAFELDRRTGELRRSGRRLHLTPQAFQLLALLAGRPGELVTRDEIREALWPGGTFVEADTAVNACVSQIRAALSDKPSSPRFVETLPRRGYRFVAPVEVVEPAVSRSTVEPARSAEVVAPAGDPVWRSRRALGMAAALVAGVAALVVVAAASGTRGGPFARLVSGRSLEALQKYERARTGLEDGSPRELADRVRFFETAIKLSPDFAEAYAGLADARLILATYRSEPPSFAYAAAKAAAAKALALDPDLGDAHAAYATAVLLLEWNWDAAARHFARGLATAPGSSRVHHWYARYLTALGRHDEARAHARRAASLAPTSPSAGTYLGVASFYAGDLDGARRHCQRAADLMPEFVPARQCLAALAQPDTSVAAMPDLVLQPAIDAVRQGDVAGALDRLQRAANQHADALVFASVQPGLKGLQGEPRFQSVLERVGLRPPTNIDR
jgi:DNA-binding winged helix-turn-helix (wHTH) protein/tetratricopeptide (TPR) repeat protein